jgi:hypothetical protein
MVAYPGVAWVPLDDDDNVVLGLTAIAEECPGQQVGYYDDELELLVLTDRLEASTKEDT